MAEEEEVTLKLTREEAEWLKKRMEIFIEVTRQDKATIRLFADDQKQALRFMEALP